MLIDRHDTLAELVARTPAASRVFQRRRLEFCSDGGRLSLEEACARVGLDPERVINEVKGEAAAAGGGDIAWEERPLSELIEHIRERYYALGEELELLANMAGRVKENHGQQREALDRLPRLCQLLAELGEELRHHMTNEERFLFPWILSKERHTAAEPITVMQREHEAAAAQLDDLRDLTDGYTAPRDTCAGWTALYLRLEELDAKLHEQIDLENNVLFRRALCE